MRRLLCCCILLTPAAAFADWWQFRGTDTSSRVSEPAVVDVEDPAAIQWKADLDGRGLSAPVVVGDRIYVTTCDGLSQEKLGTVCFDTKTGQQIWERNAWATGRTVCHEKTSNAAPSPASNGRAIFGFYSSGDVTAYDLDGRLLWYRGLGSEYPNASNSLGMSSSLVVAADVVVCMLECDADSITFGLDAETGKTLWRMDRPRMANWTSPSVLKGVDGPLVLLQSGKGVTAIRPRDGDVVWNWEEGASTIPSLTVADDQTLAVPSDGITLLQPSTSGVTPLWNEGKLSPSTASPVVAGGLVFTLNRAGVVTAATRETGSKAWQLRLSGPFSATPVVAANRLYAVSEKGKLQVVEFDDEGGEIVSSVELDEQILATPAISDGALYLRSDRHLWKFAD